MKKCVYSLCLLAVVCAVFLLAGCKEKFINGMAFYPEKMSAATVIDWPDAEEVFFNTEDGVQLQAFYFDRRGSVNDSGKALLFFHGNAGHAFHRLPDAQAISEFGISVLLVSYRGYGKSGGEPSEKGIYRDAQAAYDYLVSKKQIAKRNIFILGRSIGSTAAVNLAASNEHAGLILLTPFSSGKDMASAIGMGWLGWLVGSTFDNESKVKKLKTPLLVIHGDKDEVVPYKFGQKLYRASPASDKQFIAVKGGGHNNLSLVVGSVLWQWVGKFVLEKAGINAPVQQ